MIIRKWTYDDAAALAYLNAQWGYPCAADEMKQRLNELSSLNNHEVFVAEETGEVVGWIHVYRKFSMGTKPYAEIGGLVVDEKKRLKGIGKMLLQKAGEWSKEHGLTTLRVRTGVKREVANVFYSKCGFTCGKQQNVFEIRL